MRSVIGKVNVKAPKFSGLKNPCANGAKGRDYLKKSKFRGNKGAGQKELRNPLK